MKQEFAEENTQKDRKNELRNRVAANFGCWDEGKMRKEGRKEEGRR